MNEILVSTKSTRSQILTKLTAACDWAGISRGRALEYGTLFAEHFTIEEKTREHIFAYNELSDVSEVYELWLNEVGLFPGLKDMIREAFSSGPLLREDERPGNSGSRPRNDAFPIILAGKLNKAGITVASIEGIRRNKNAQAHDSKETIIIKSDIAIEHCDLLIPIECKRPQSLEAMHARAAEARRQLSGMNGIIAIDCSAAIRPAGQVLEAQTEKKAADFIDRLLISKVVPVVRRQFRKYVIGAILYTRVPVHTVHKISPILDSAGNPVTTYNLVTATTLFFVANPNSPHAKAFRSMKDAYMATLSAVGQSHSKAS